MAQPTDYEALRKFCRTERQAEILDLVIAHKGLRPAAREVNVRYSSICDVVKTIKRYAASRGYDPEHHVNFPVSDGLRLKGTSDLVDLRTGERVMQWIKTVEDPERQREFFEAFSRGMSREYPQRGPIKSPLNTREELLNCYVLSDVHIGMYASAAECGITLETLATEIEAKEDQWITVDAQIEANRVAGKDRVREAVDQAGVEVARDNAVAAIEVL